MSSVLIGYALAYGYILLVLLAAGAAGLPPEGRRKLVHMALVFTWCMILKPLGGTVHMVIIPCSFVALNLVSYLVTKYADGFQLPILCAMERPGAEETPGAVYYAASMAGMGALSYLWPQLTAPCGVGLFCMAFGDGMAAIVGTHATGLWAKQPVRGKSLGGSVACAAGSLLGCSLLCLLMGYALWPLLVPISLGSAVLELPRRGLDNITVPFGCMLLAALLVYAF